MVDKNYKLIISGRGIYREIPLVSDDKRKIKFGTKKGCEVRFRKELFFDGFAFSLIFENQQWNLQGEENIYFTINGVIKIASKLLQHGDEVLVKTQKQNAELFHLQFVLDFDSELRNYERKVNLFEKDTITIGSKVESDIYLREELLKEENVILRRQEDSWIIQVHNSQFGVYINGKRMKDSSILTDYDFISIGSFRFYYKNRQLYMEKSDRVTIQNLLYEDFLTSKSYLEYPNFTRNTRIVYEIPDETYNILQPEQKEQEPERNFFVQLFPLFISVMAMMSIQSMYGNGSNMILYSVAMALAGLITTIILYFWNKKEYKKKCCRRESEYKEYIEKKREELFSLQEEELQILKRTYLDINENLLLLEDFDKRLFEKEEEHSDYLCFRIGEGRKCSGYKIEIGKEERKLLDDELQKFPEQVKENFQYLEKAPIVIDLKMNAPIGVVGEKEFLYQLGKNITIDIAARHYYNKVKFFYMFEGNEVENFQWIKWLPHTTSVDGSFRNIICDDVTRNALLEFLYNELTKRMETQRENQLYQMVYIVFVYDTVKFLDHPVANFIKKANKCGIYFLFFANHEEFLPNGCKEVVRLVSDKEGKVVLSEKGQNIQSFHYPNVSNEKALEFSKRMSPIQIKEVSLDSQLTKSITMYELLEIYSETDMDYGMNWRQSKVYESMAAPIGVVAKNEKIYLDLHEKFHGPHGLVAGTTGSGKSEVLQTYILSMAILFHPYDVSFVLIDFKGGGMLNQFKDLPHLAGTITNIDGKEIDRSLKSIKAELRKRQELFSQHGVNHIDQYIKKFKEKEANVPLPHLILIVDEFAELKVEYPDFMAELISAARIGRSLGVHLILATQKPSGVVDDQIWSNSKFKICLKVQDASDSNEMIKVGLAAEIREPGRGYLQVGNNEIFELFQSAYSGATILEDEERIKTFELAAVDFAGRRQVIYSNKENRKDKEEKKQLDAIVEGINLYCQKNQIEKIPNICLKSLEDKIYLSDIKKYEKNIELGIQIPIGVYDDPDYQKQSEVLLNLSAENTYIIGAAQSGKTTLLQTILYTLIREYSPKEVNIYIIDFGTMALKVFERSNHVGGVVLSTEEEKMNNLFKMLKEEIAKRKEILLEKGIGTFAAYKEAGFRDIAQIILVIDNYIGFKEYYDELVEEIEVLSRDGLSVGINLLLTEVQGIGLGYRGISNFATRISLFQNDVTNYGNIFENCRIEPKHTPGRGLFLLNKRILEFQVALSVEAEKEYIRNQKVVAFIEERNKELENQFAKMIPQVPKTLTEETLNKYCMGKEFSGFEIPIGIDYNEIKIQSIDLLKNNVISIMGREQSGKSNLIQSMIKRLVKQNEINSLHITVFEQKGGPLGQCYEEGLIHEYYNEIDTISKVLERLTLQLEERSDRYYEDAETLAKEPMELLVLDNWDVVEWIGRNMELSEKMEAIIEEYSRFKVAIIFGNVPNMSIGYGAPDIYKMAKNASKMIMFESLSIQKLFDFTISELRENNKLLSVGDAFIGNEDKMLRIKTVKYKQKG